MNELISIIVPTYNRAHFLSKIISNILSQTHTNFELLILDDCSTDNTSEIVANFSDARINYIRHLCNIGFVANWTYGVKLAKGIYMAILGDDDVYGPNFLINRLDAFRRNSGLIAVTGPFQCCDSIGNVTRSSRPPCAAEKIFSGRELVQLNLGLIGEWSIGATLYKTEVFQALWQNVMFAGTALDQTMHIYLSLLPKAEILFLNKNDVMIRLHAGQESQSNNLFLAESAALMSIKLWCFLIKPRNRNIDLYKKRFSADLNNYARILWDRGFIKESRVMFGNELRLSPMKISSWARYVRTYLVDIEK